MFSYYEKGELENNGKANVFFCRRLLQSTTAPMEKANVLNSLFDSGNKKKIFVENLLRCIPLFLGMI